jgi:hypothetical protein
MNKLLKKGEKCKYKIFVQHLHLCDGIFHFLSQITTGTVEKHANYNQEGHISLSKWSTFKCRTEVLASDKHSSLLQENGNYTKEVL